MHKSFGQDKKTNRKRIRAAAAELPRIAAHVKAGQVLAAVDV